MKRINKKRAAKRGCVKRQIKESRLRKVGIATALNLILRGPMVFHPRAWLNAVRSFMLNYQNSWVVKYRCVMCGDEIHPRLNWANTCSKCFAGVPAQVIKDENKKWGRTYLIPGKYKPEWPDVRRSKKNEQRGR